MGMRTSDKTFTGLRTFFEWDDKRLADLLDKVARSLEAGELARAERAFVHYARGMKRHLRLADETLLQFYAFERTGTAKGPAVSLPAEHARIVALLDEMQEALLAGDLPAAKAVLGDLACLLPEHKAVEERIYPVVESLLGAAEAERLLTRLAGR
jgi:hemerythrin HHE cation binding domain-containing protein